MNKRIVTIQIEVDMDSAYIKEWSSKEDGFESAVEEAIDDITSPYLPGWRYKKKKEGQTAEGCAKYTLTYKALNK